MAVGERSYYAGEILVTSGTVQVDTPGEVNAVIFIGGNWTGVDSIDTSSGTGMFMGMAGPHWSTGLDASYAVAFVPDGDSWQTDTVPILAPSPAGDGTSIYRATFGGFTGAGFSVNFTQVLPGARVYYLAWGDFDNYAVTNGNNTDNFGFWAKSGFVVHADFTADPVGIGSANFYHGVSFGSGAWHTSNFLDWNSMAATADSYPTSNSAQGMSSLFHSSGSTAYMGETSGFIGPFMRTGWISAWPVDGNRTQFTHSGEHHHWFLCWDGVSQTNYMNVPSATVGATATTTFSHLEAIDALFFFSVSDAPQGQSNSAGWAMGLGISTEDFQACVMVDRYPTCAYQSNTRGWISCLDTSGARAGTVDWTSHDNIATLVTADTLASAGSLGAIAFLGEEEAPQFFRVVYR